MRRRNPDDRLRDLERRALQGDFAAYVAAQAERLRLGLPFTPHSVDPTNGAFEIANYAFGNGVHADVMNFEDPEPYKVCISAHLGAGPTANGIHAARWAPFDKWVGYGGYEVHFDQEDLADGKVEQALRNLAMLDVREWPPRANPPEEFFDTSSADRGAEEAADARARTIDHLWKFQAAMAPDPREWEFEPPVGDAGPGSREKCVCGHPIRNLYMIVRARDGKKIQVGSVCVESTVPYLQAHGAVDLAASLARALEQQQKLVLEMGRKKRAAAGDSAVAALTHDWQTLQAWLNATWKHEEDKDRQWRYGSSGYYASSRAQVPDWLYALRGFRNARPKALTTPGRTATSMRNALRTTYVVALGMPGVSHSVPMPTETKLREALREHLAKTVAFERDLEARGAAGALKDYEPRFDGLRMDRAANALARLDAGV